MKTFLCSLFLMAGFLLFASSTELAAQASCPWTFCNEIDCSFTFRVYMNCPMMSPVPMHSQDAIGPGCWDNPTCKNFVVLQCNPGTACYYTVSLNNVMYEDGDIICCDPDVAPEECSPCNCAYVEIDHVTRTVRLVPARSGTNPEWDCDDDLR